MQCRCTPCHKLLKQPFSTADLFAQLPRPFVNASSYRKQSTGSTQLSGQSAAVSGLVQYNPMLDGLAAEGAAVMVIRAVAACLMAAAQGDSLGAFHAQRTERSLLYRAFPLRNSSLASAHFLVHCLLHRPHCAAECPFQTAACNPHVRQRQLNLPYHPGLKAEASTPRSCQH